MDAAATNDPGLKPPVLRSKLSGGDRLVLWLVLAGFLIAGVYAFADPAQAGFFPRCVFHRITGLNCPGCGGQRALHHLLHGDFAGAFRMNALFVCCLPFLAWWVAACLLERFASIKVKRPFASARWWWSLAIVFIVYGVTRNLPGFGWLSP